MAQTERFKLCQSEEDVCKREVQAWCYHCSKNLCRVHLLKHVQLVEDKIREELNLFADQFNELSNKFNDLHISSNILEKPFSLLDQWSYDAHAHIDHIVEMKRQRLNDIIDDYRRVFSMKKDDHMKKIDVSRKLLVKLIEDNDGTRQQTHELQTSIDEAMNYLNSLDEHRITLIAPLPDCSIDIRQEFQNFTHLINNDIREMEIIYIQLNGIIRSYRISTKKNGNIRDLKLAFIDHYIKLKSDSIPMLKKTIDYDHQPKSAFILAVEVYNHRIHLQFEETHPLNLIQDQDKIVFYEMPYSLEESNNPRILMPCSFRTLPNKQPFGLPIFLNIPRRGCRGQDLIEVILNTLGNFFPFDPQIDQSLYDVSLVRFAGGSSKAIKLNTILQDEIDLLQTNAQILIDIHGQIAETYQQSYSK